MPQHKVMDVASAGAARLSALLRLVWSIFLAPIVAHREIASRPVIAERTAAGHVQSILNKMGFYSRTRIAAWAVEHGLATFTRAIIATGETTGRLEFIENAPGVRPGGVLLEPCAAA